MTLKVTGFIFLRGLLELDNKYCPGAFRCLSWSYTTHCTCVVVCPETMWMWFFVSIENQVVSDILSCTVCCWTVCAVCCACVRERAGLFSKYEPLTRGDGLNPNHDGFSTDLQNEFCVLSNKSLSRERKQPTFFLFLCSCKNGWRKIDEVRRW